MRFSNFSNLVLIPTNLFSDLAIKRRNLLPEEVGRAENMRTTIPPLDVVIISDDPASLQTEELLLRYPEGHLKKIEIPQLSFTQLQEDFELNTFLTSDELQLLERFTTLAHERILAFDIIRGVIFDEFEPVIKKIAMMAINCCKESLEDNPDDLTVGIIAHPLMLDIIIHFLPEQEGHHDNSIEKILLPGEIVEIELGDVFHVKRKSCVTTS